MNIFLWIVQILLGVHTLIGAIWKFSNPAQAMPSLAAIPNAIWLLLAIVEIVVAIVLILPLVYKPAGQYVPIAALFIIAEMLLFCIVNLFSGKVDYGQITYWIVVMVVAGFVYYARKHLLPIA